MSEIQQVDLSTASLEEYRAATRPAEPTNAFEKQPEPAQEAQPEVEQEPAKPKGKGGFQARIDRLVKQNAALEEKLEQERKAKPKEAEKQAPVSDEPQRDQFQSEPDYYRALARWEVKQEMKQEKERERMAEIQTREQTLKDTYNERVTEARAKYEDFDDIVGHSTIKVPGITAPTLLRLVNGPEVAYYLGNNQEVCKELGEMDEFEAIAKLHEISREIAAEADEPEDKPEEQEPRARRKPIRPVGSGTSRQSTVPLDKASISDYRKDYERRTARDRR